MNNGALVIDSPCDRGGDEDAAIAGLYCGFVAEQEQSTANLLGGEESLGICGRLFRGRRKYLAAEISYSRIWWKLSRLFHRFPG